MVKQHPNTNLLDFEKAKLAGQVLTSADEARLRNTQLRQARKMYLNTLTMSEREPLWKNGPRGERNTHWSKVRWLKLEWKFFRFYDQFGINFLNKITGGPKTGYRPWRADFHWLQKNGVRDWSMTLARNVLIRFPVASVCVWTFFGVYIYYSAWNSFVHFHHLVKFQHYPPAECLPEDKKIVARLCDTYPVRFNRAVALKADRKEFPLGTRYDWLEGKPVLPDDPNYYWIDGRPIRKDSKYFHPGPKEVMGKRAYEEDAFFNAEGYPKNPTLGMPTGGHGHDHH